MIQFTFREQDQDHPERPRRAAALRLRVRFKVGRAQGPFTIERDNDSAEGPDRSAGEINRIVRNWTKTPTVGARLDIHAQNNVFTLRAVEVAPAVSAPDTHPVIAALYVRVFTKYGWVTNLGNWYCRYISGTHTVSRHGYYAPTWKGAAQDFGAENGDQLLLLAYAIVHWATDPTDPAFYGKIATVIVHDRIWTQGSGWSGYGGVYHYHVHADTEAGVPCSP